MGWTAPRTWVAGETATAAQLNTHLRDDLTFLKSGVAAVTTITTSSGSTTGTTELVIATSPAVTLDGTTLVTIQFTWYNIQLTVATDSFLVRLYDGPTAGSGTQLGQWLLIPAANGGSGILRATITPSAAAHTYTARLVCNVGTGTALLFASATTPATITVNHAT